MGPFEHASRMGEIHNAIEEKTSTTVTVPAIVPLVGGRQLTLPEAGSLAYDVAIVAFVVAEVIEPPIGVILLVGRWLQHRRHKNKFMEAVDEALQDAEHA